MTTEKYVCKFGGTSMADAAAMRQAAEIVKADPRRRYIVVLRTRQAERGG